MNEELLAELRRTEKVIVTRSQLVADAIIRSKIVPEDTVHLRTARMDQVQDKHVVGMIPLDYAAECAFYTPIFSRRGYEHELTTEEVLDSATYIIERVQ